MRDPGQVVARTVRAIALVIVGALAVTGCDRPDVLDLPTATAEPTPSVPGPAVTPGPSSSEPASVASDPSPAPTDDDPGGATTTGSFPAGLGVEISGAAAGRDVDGLWIADDEPGTDRVHLVALDGRLLATVAMTGVDTVNIEDLAVGPCPDDSRASCVHVGDTGDNVGGRPDVVVLSFPESIVGEVTDGRVVEVAPGIRRLRFDGAPVDCEALVVTPDGSLVLIDRTPEEAGLHVARPGAEVMTRVGVLPLPEPRNRMLAQVVGHVATAADLAADGAVLVLRTYDQLALLRPPDGTPLTGDDVARLASWEVQDLGRVPDELQGEAAALLADGRVATIAEGSTAITVTTPPVG